MGNRIHIGDIDIKELREREAVCYENEVYRVRIHSGCNVVFMFYIYGNDKRESVRCGYGLL